MRESNPFASRRAAEDDAYWRYRNGFPKRVDAPAVHEWQRGAPPTRRAGCAIVDMRSLRMHASTYEAMALTMRHPSLDIDVLLPPYVKWDRS